MSRATDKICAHLMTRRVAAIATHQTMSLRKEVCDGISLLLKILQSVRCAASSRVTLSTAESWDFFYRNETNNLEICAGRRRGGSPGFFYSGGYDLTHFPLNPSHLFEIMEIFATFAANSGQSLHAEGIGLLFIHLRLLPFWVRSLNGDI